MKRWLTRIPFAGPLFELQDLRDENELLANEADRLAAIEKARRPRIVFPPGTQLLPGTVWTQDVEVMGAEKPRIFGGGAS